MSEHGPLVPLFSRGSGVLLHPTSLPGRLGIGNLGAPARRFVDWLAEAGQTWWQVLPLGPTTFGDSPYQTLSAFAGNPGLIDPDDLIAREWLAPVDVDAAVAAELEAAVAAGVAPAFGRPPILPEDRVDYGRAIPLVAGLLDRAWEGFQVRASDALRSELEAWCAARADWLDDYALFAALKEHHGGRPWPEWPAGERRHEPAALRRVREELAGPIARQRFRQWVFHRQWAALRGYARERGVRLLGDVPIFVAHDSADVWAHPDLFQLDAKGYPTVVAGVPPDYFSKTGQRWGNPLYRWNVLSERGHDWWIARFRSALALVDAVRLDHFRGLAAYWEIPASEPTAVKGRWVRGPGAHLLATLREALGPAEARGREGTSEPAGKRGAPERAGAGETGTGPALPIVAEDLGVITPDVEKLRDDFGLPGMKVLQFAWSDPKNPFLPHAHVPNSVAYSGTHDNNTTVGWWHGEAGPAARRFVAAYLGRDDADPHRGLADFEREPHWALIRLGMMSVAHTFIAPMQDVLGLGPETRLNTPSRAEGNWTWRVRPEQLDDPAQARLAELTRLYRRRADQQARPETSDPALEE